MRKLYERRDLAKTINDLDIHTDAFVERMTAEFLERANTLEQGKTGRQ